MKRKKWVGSFSDISSVPCQLQTTKLQIKKVHLLGFSFLPDDQYNLNLSFCEKVNPQKCFIYFYETWEVEKEVVDL